MTPYLSDFFDTLTPPPGGAGGGALGETNPWGWEKKALGKPEKHAYLKFTFTFTVYV